jgi:hypothetical protein
MFLMNSVLSKYLDKFVLVFVDDILVYSKTKEDHGEHLRTMLHVLRDNCNYSQLNKCDFFHNHIDYLCHTISVEEEAVDTEKIKAVMDWTAP